MRNRVTGRQSGQATVELGGVLGLIALIVAAVVVLGLGAPVARAIKCDVEKVLGQAGCTTAASPYRVVCRVSTSTSAAQLDVKIVFVRVSDNDTLVKMTYSDGSSTYLLTHAGSVQAEAAIGAELEAGGFGGDWMASAAAGGQLAGAQEWDFQSPAQAAAFDKEVSSHGGWNQIAHDVVSGLPLGLGSVAGWGLNHLGVHDSSGLPSATSKYVKGGLVGGVKAGVQGGVGGASAALDGQLEAALGVRLTVSGPQKGQTQVYLTLNGSATASLQAALFGPSSVKGSYGGSAQGQATATVTLSPSGQPLNVTITAWGGATVGPGSNGTAKGPEAAAIQKALKKAALKGYDGRGSGLQWTGTIDLTKHPDDISAVLGALTGNTAPLLDDFNSDGSQQIQPFKLHSSSGGAGAEGDFGVGVGVEGKGSTTTQSYSPGLVKPPGQAWGPMLCGG